MLRHLLAEHPEHLNWYAALFFNLRDIRTPYMSAPGFPRNADTDVEMYRAFLEWESPEFSMDFILGQIDVYKRQSQGRSSILSISTVLSWGLAERSDGFTSIKLKWSC